MNAITQADTQSVSEQYAAKQTTEKKTSGRNLGKTIGSPELSEKAQKYYEQLKKKYHNMDFILVSEDKKEEAQAHASNYAGSDKMTVLIDTEKIERMAEDTAYRKQYEGLIESASVRLTQFKTSIVSSGANVKSYGMKVNDGGAASFFATVDKSMRAQRKQSEKRQEKRVADKRAAKRKEEKEKTAGSKEKDKTTETGDDTVTLTASSLEELLQKIKDYAYEDKSNNVLTEDEKLLGQHVDYKG